MSKNRFGNWKIDNVELSYRVYGTKNRKTSTTKSPQENHQHEKTIVKVASDPCSSNETAKIDIFVKQAHKNDQLVVNKTITQPTQAARTQTIGYAHSSYFNRNNLRHSQHSISARSRSGSDSVSRGVETERTRGKIFNRFSKKKRESPLIEVPSPVQTVIPLTDFRTKASPTDSLRLADEKVISSTLYVNPSRNSFSEIARKKSDPKSRKKRIENEPSFISKQALVVGHSKIGEKRSSGGMFAHSGEGSKPVRKHSGTKKCCGLKKKHRSRSRSHESKKKRKRGSKTHAVGSHSSLKKKSSESPSLTRKEKNRHSKDLYASEVLAGLSNKEKHAVEHERRSREWKDIPKKERRKLKKLDKERSSRDLSGLSHREVKQIEKHESLRSVQKASSTESLKKKHRTVDFNRFCDDKCKFAGKGRRRRRWISRLLCCGYF